MSLSLSLWCKPIDGSSKTYKTPVSLEPIWVASLILWLSPPLNVEAVLPKVKYSSPTSIKKPTLFFISFKTIEEIASSVGVNFKLFKNSLNFFKDKLQTSAMLSPPTLIDKTSLFNLSPLQTVQVCSRIKLK